MATYLYGLILARNAHLVPAHITGIGGSALRVLSCGGIDALVSTITQKPSPPSLNDVRDHDHALQSVVHHGATAAATRFGQTFPNDDDTRSHVAEGGERIARVLETHDGCVEMRLLLPLAKAPTSATPAEAHDSVTGAKAAGEGARYLQALRARTAAGRDMTAQLGVRDALVAFVRAERVEEMPHGRAVAFSHLVRREHEPSYRAAIKTLPTLEAVTIVGPLALYTFAEPLP